MTYTRADRQTGRTTQQIVEAPQCAMFVWPNTALHYPRQLAIKANREDLAIRSLSWLFPPNIIGRKFTAVVIDHEAWQRLEPENLRAIEYLKSRFIPVL